jgi:hypothetical protein
MTRRERARGVTLPEFVVVGSLVALTVALLSPVIVERARIAKGRTMAAQLALDVRAARWIAVSNRSAVSMTFDVDAETYTYVDAHGKTRTVEMPEGVDLVSSTNPVEFLANGSVPGGAATVIEIKLGSGARSRWKVVTNALGVSKTLHFRLDP